MAHDDTLKLLGTLLDETATRDAVHVAVCPVIAAHILRPGDRIGWVDEEHVEMGRVPHLHQQVGIVDPFLRDRVMPGQRFFVFLFPQTIQSMKHVWSHPAFPDEVQIREVVREVPVAAVQGDKAASEKWLRNWCKEISYEELLEIAVNGTSNSFTVYNDILVEYGGSSYGDIPDEVWDHVEVVLGKRVRHKPTHFSCSC